MTPLTLQSEPYAATGNIGDGGFRRLLGTPSLDVLQLVIREAVQNSCDAAKLGRGPGILIRLRTLRVDEVRLLREAVLQELPFVPESKAPIEAFLASGAPRVLEIADFRTSGLGGPTRADRMREDTERTDFIDFLRNVGTQRNTDQGGGTYGFGKASLYMASRCSTVLVDTVIATLGGHERRIMGCHLGPSGSRSTGDGFVNRYTGRHWWGVRGEEGVTEPATGDLAELIARSLGLPERLGGQTGTTIMILDPELGEAELPEAGEESDDESLGLERPSAEPGLERTAGRLAGELLWNFWPRLMRTCPDERRIDAQVFCEDLKIELPFPEDVPPLDHFCAAMDMIRTGDRAVIPIRKYGRVLGRLAVFKGVRGHRVPPFDEPGSVFDAASAGIATMRPVELVVRVEAGTPLPDHRVEWAGVFVASSDPDIEQAFARSEPAAHDTWDPATLGDETQRKWVRAAIRRIREVGRSVAAPEPTPAKGDEEGTALAAVAGTLGQFLKGHGHGGPMRNPGGGVGAAGGPRRRRASTPVFRRLLLQEGRPAAEFVVMVSGRGPQDTLVLEPAFSVEGAGLAVEDEVGFEIPLVLSVQDPSGELTTGSGTVPIGDQEGEVRVLVSIPPDCAVTLKAALERRA